MQHSLDTQANPECSPSNRHGYIACTLNHNTTQVIPSNLPPQKLATLTLKTSPTISKSIKDKMALALYISTHISELLLFFLLKTKKPSLSVV